MLLELLSSLDEYRMTMLDILSQRKEHNQGIMILNDSLAVKYRETLVQYQEAYDEMQEILQKNILGDLT